MGLSVDNKLLSTKIHLKVTVHQLATTNCINGHYIIEWSEEAMNGYITRLETLQ